MKLTATCYLQLKPIRRPYGGGLVAGFTVARMTSRKPTRPLGGTLLARINFTIPPSAFAPLLTADIDLPDGGYEVTPEISVEPMGGEDTDAP